MPGSFPSGCKHAPTSPLASILVFQEADSKTELDMQKMYWNIFLTDHLWENMGRRLGEPSDCDADLTPVKVRKKEERREGQRKVLDWIATPRKFWQYSEGVLRPKSLVRGVLCLGGTCLSCSPCRFWSLAVSSPWNCIVLLWLWREDFQTTVPGTTANYVLHRRRFKRHISMVTTPLLTSSFCGLL